MSGEYIKKHKPIRVWFYGCCVILYNSYCEVFFFQLSWTLAIYIYQAIEWKTYSKLIDIRLESSSDFEIDSIAILQQLASDYLFHYCFSFMIVFYSRPVRCTMWSVLLNERNTHNKKKAIFTQHLFTCQFTFLRNY